MQFKAFSGHSDRSRQFRASAGCFAATASIHTQTADDTASHRTCCKHRALLACTRILTSRNTCHFITCGHVVPAAKLCTLYGARGPSRGVQPGSWPQPFGNSLLIETRADSVMLWKPRILIFSDCTSAACVGLFKTTRVRSSILFHLLATYVSLTAHTSHLDNPCWTIRCVPTYTLLRTHRIQRTHTRIF